MEIESINSKDTERIGEKLARNLRGGEVIELVSDLGGGKTTFVRGLVAGLGSDDRVASPTFTLSKLYKTKRFDVHHFDFYRLADAGLVGLELHDLLGDPQNIVIVEWGGSVQHVLPEDKLRIEISRTGDDARQIRVTCKPSLGYTVKGLS